MAYSLQLQHFENITSTTISLQILNKDHVVKLLQEDPEKEFIRLLMAGITGEKIEEQTSDEFGKNNKTIISLYLAIMTPEFSGLINVGFISKWWIYSIWIPERLARKGIAFGALKMICDQLKTFQPAEIWADINTRNTASVGLFKKVGFYKSFEEEGGGALFKLT